MINYGSMDATLDCFTAFLMGFREAASGYSGRYQAILKHHNLEEPALLPSRQKEVKELQSIKSITIKRMSHGKGE